MTKRIFNCALNAVAGITLAGVLFYSGYFTGYQQRFEEDNAYNRTLIDINSKSKRQRNHPASQSAISDSGLQKVTEEEMLKTNLALEKTEQKGR